MKKSFFARVAGLYYDGFRNMSWWGRRVWLIVLIKLFIMFAILRVFFFPDILGKKFDTDSERSEYIIEQLTNTPANHD